MNTELGKELTKAWRIINVLHMAQMDEGEAWPEALEWLARNEDFKPNKDQPTN